MRRTLLALALLAAGCADGGGLPPFEHYAALQVGLVRTEAAIAAKAAASTGTTEEAEPDHVRGLVQMLATTTGRTRALPLEEIGMLGDAAAPTLAVIAAASDGEASHRQAALQLLAHLRTPLATEHLLQLCERSPEPWMRAQAAWRLSLTGQDWVVPRLTKRLKYEVDEDAVIWIANTLGLFGNYSGLEALYRLWNSGATPELRSSAELRIFELAQHAGAKNPEHLWELWFVADPDKQLHRTDASPRLERELWRRVSDLSGEHFQLRGVDDARFTLSHLGSWATGPLSEALHDDDLYVRVHVAQCLERMGPRATLAGPALVAALGDPSLANDAALALGAVAYPSAAPLLGQLLVDPLSEHGLRVSCASSLGRIGLSASAPALQEVLANAEPYDLRQACARALCQLGLGGKGAASFLRDALTEPAADRFGAEVALAEWLASLDGNTSTEVLEAWAALGQSPGAISTPAEDKTRLQARQTLLSERWDQLNGR